MEAYPDFAAGVSVEAQGVGDSADSRDGRRRSPGISVLVFGAALPLFTLLFEIVSGFCACLSFDPIPTVWHMLLAAVVPAANVWAFLTIRRAEPDRARLLGWPNAFAAGVCAYYTAVFLPLAPIGLVALAVLGAGLLPLTPGLALIVTLILRRGLRQCAARERGTVLPGLWPGFAAGMGLLLLLDAPGLLTFAGAKLALRPRTGADGIGFLRSYGNDGELLRLCFPMDRPLAPSGLVRRALRAMDTRLPGLAEIEPEQAQKLYYRLTGVPYNAVKPPDGRCLRGRAMGQLAEADEFDFGQGGNAVAAPLKGLLLAESRIESAVDSTSGVSQTEWTLTFRNDSVVPREARAQIALPPGGVVSRLTLWIDGQEREAAYGERGRVKAAYSAVVQKKRDPVVATVSGRDRVLVQCFPVPPQGGTMKTRIGITAPLLIESRTRSRLRLPFLVERNFGLSEGHAHSVRILADAPMTAPAYESGLVCDKKGASHTCEGNLTSTRICGPFTISLTGTATAEQAWTGDAGGIVLQRLVERTEEPRRGVVLVVDGSAGMERHRDRIAAAIRRLSTSVPLGVIMAGDQPIELRPLGEPTGEARRGGERLEDGMRFGGGRDNLLALDRAFRTAASLPGAAVAWVHGVQPVELSDATGLAKTWAASDPPPPLYELQLEPGPSVAARGFDEAAFARSVPETGDADADLDRLTAILAGTAARFVPERRRAESGDGIPSGAHAPGFLTRLWANDEVRRLAASGTSEDRTNAVRLATEYRIVTPVSGAVVLESEEQYTRAGLRPVEPGSTPTPVAVPEPETWSLLAAGIAAAACRCLWRRRRSARAAA